MNSARYAPYVPRHRPRHRCASGSSVTRDEKYGALTASKPSADQATVIQPCGIQPRGIQPCGAQPCGNQPCIIQPRGNVHHSTSPYGNQPCGFPSSVILPAAPRQVTLRHAATRHAALYHKQARPRVYCNLHFTGSRYPSFVSYKFTVLPTWFRFYHVQTTNCDRL